MPLSNYKIAGQTQAMALSGIELACWDIAGKAAGVPVWKLLGGQYRDRVPVYASSMRRHTTAAEEAADLAGLVEKHGFRAVKVKIGQRMGKDEDAAPGRSEALVRECRRVLGDGIAIMMDANGAYSAPRTPQEFSLASITGEHHLKGLLQEPALTVEDGCLRVPDGPGLGVVLDEKRLAELRAG